MKGKLDRRRRTNCYFVDALSDELAKQLQEKPAKTARFLGSKMVLALVVGLVMCIVIGGISTYILLMPGGYQPVDVSNIPDGQQKLLSELVKNIKKMPAQSREAFLCEQLGLCFATDGSKVMRRDAGPATSPRASFIGKSGHPQPFGQACKASKSWSQCYAAALQMNKFKEGAVLSFFKKDIDCIVYNTAKYLLKEMPNDMRWALLATLDQKLYYQDGRSASDQEPYTITLDSGHTYRTTGDWNGYFVGADGKEEKAWDALRKAGRYGRYMRWCNLVLACADLVGARDILDLFPDEVKAMRKHYKERQAQLKE